MMIFADDDVLEWPEDGVSPEAESGVSGEADEAGREAGSSRSARQRIEMYQEARRLQRLLSDEYDL